MFPYIFLFLKLNGKSCFRTLVVTEGAQETLRPMLPQILTEYFRIINEAESPDNVLSALQAIIDHFGDEITPMAPAIVDGLIRVFQVQTFILSILINFNLLLLLNILY